MEFKVEDDGVVVEDEVGRVFGWEGPAIVFSSLYFGCVGCELMCLVLMDL